MSDRLLTTAEAAGFLKVSAASIRRWTDAGLLHASRVGRRQARRLREDDLLAFMEANQGGRMATTSKASPRSVPIQGMAVPIGSHLIQLSSSDRGLTRLVFPFLRDGLSAGQTCIVFSSSRWRELFLGELRRHRVDVDAARRSGVLVLLSPKPRSVDECLLDFEEVLIAASQARPGPIRFVGEALAAVPAHRPLKALVALEHGCAALTKRFPLVMLCPYDCRRVDGQTVLEVLRLHLDTFEHEVGYFLG
jgi:excisionase family DNA binding protein